MKDGVASEVFLRQVLEKEALQELQTRVQQGPEGRFPSFFHVRSFFFWAQVESRHGTLQGQGL